MKFEEFGNVNVTGIDAAALDSGEKAVLYHQARYCQAMTDADIDTLRELTAEDKTYTHMSGKKQTREEYFSDIADGSLTYYTIGIADPVIKVNGDSATITYTSVLNANAYKAIKKEMQAGILPACFMILSEKETQKEKESAV